MERSRPETLVDENWMRAYSATQPTGWEDIMGKDQKSVRLNIPYITDEQADILRTRMSQGQQTLLITVDKRTLSIDLDCAEVLEIAHRDREHFSKMESETDWSLAMCNTNLR